jgi:hypothetical protein
MSFDADSFMNTTIEGAMDTKVVPIPEGEYEATIENFNVRQFEGKTIDENTGQLRVITSMDIIWNIRDEQLARDLARDKVNVRGNIFLDMTPEGTLDLGKGKNISLGRLREALGQNDPNRPWTPGMLKGAGPLMIKVTQRANPNDPSQIFNDVKSFTGI